MPAANSDLHGNAPDTSPLALLVVDVVNDLEFEGGEALLAPAVAAAERIAALKERCAAAGVPVIYANDNFGRWRSDFREVVQHVVRDGVRGAAVLRRVLPGPDDYFVLKPKHSAFYSTTLDTLLRYLGSRRLIITGLQADACVLLTAGDAYMRDFRVSVPEDCVASASGEDTGAALAYMRRVLDADTTPSAALDLEALAGSVRRG